MSDLGTFASIQEAWKKYPNGGKEGDTLIIKGIKYSWDKYNMVWKANGEESFSDGYPVSTIEGDLSVMNDLRVGGTLHANRIRGADRGLIPDIDSLPKNVQDGDWCILGDTIPGPIWRVVNGVWENTGEIGGVDPIDLVGYATTKELNVVKETLGSSISDIINEKGAPSGTAPLDEYGKVPSRHLPGFVDDVKEFYGIIEEDVSIAQSTGLIGDVVYVHPARRFVLRIVEDDITTFYDEWDERDLYMVNSTPITDKIYVDVSETEGNHKKTYRWSGSDLAVIGTDLTLGETSSTAFSGDRGKKLENEMDNIPKDIISPDSLSVNPFENTVDVEYKKFSKESGKETNGSFNIPAATEAKAGVMSAEDKKTLKTLKESGGSGGGFYDMTKLHPLEEGYYTLDTAVSALKNAELIDDKKSGLIITFEISPGKWEDYRFSGTDISSFLVPASWERYGGGDSVNDIIVNGVMQEKDEEGNVNLHIEQIEVDESLDADSTNAIQNGSVAAKFNEIEANTLFDVEPVVDEENNSVKLIFKNKSGAEITSAEFQGGTSGGGGGESGNLTKIVLTASVNHSIVKEGDGSVLTWFYDHQYSSGDDKGVTTGQKATVVIQAKRGSQTVYSETIRDVSTGTYTLDLSKYLMLGTTEILVKASTIDPETGKTQAKQSFTSVKVITLSLASSYNVSSGMSGYGGSDIITIPYTLSGTGEKVVTLYVDGVQTDTATVTKSGTTNGNFTLPSGLSIGRHTIQMVAEMEQENLTISSESIYFDINKVGTDEPFIGTKHIFQDGRIFTGDHLTPTLEVGQYEKLSFDFVAYDRLKTPADLKVFINGVQTQSVSVPRKTQVYTNRFTEQGTYDIEFRSGNTTYPFHVDVTKSGIDIAETTSGLLLKLTASGRSNSEENPDTWTYGDITTKFDGFNWSWTGDSLKLTNGASIDIGYQPFKTDAFNNGGTYEIELECSNVTDRKGIILECMNGGVGFQMSTNEARICSSGGTEVSTKFASDMNLKIAFVIGKKSGHRLMELYVNGSRCGCVQYAPTESLIQDTPANIRISSDAADVEVRSLRVYDRGLTDEEEFSNYVVDRSTSDEMVILFENNDVLNEEGTDVDIDKLRAKGKAVMRIVGDVNLVNATNNKKFEVPVDIYFYSPYGKEYDFYIKGAGLRIQGTSSTTYPRKNYRLYFSRSDKYNTEFYINGVLQQDADGNNIFLYSFKPGARPIDIFCLKADFSDSSSTQNTGGVRIVNDIWKQCGWLTPPQAAYKGEYDVRIGVDGFPMDLFCAQEDGGANTYFGKYNFNNEKSDSGIIYGFEGIEGFNDTATLNGQRNKCICLEFLNNSHPLCLFGTSNITEEEFSEGLEFRFKPDQTWATADAEDKAAVQRLWSWIDSCKGNHVKFLNEYTQYFGNDSPFAWYLITDYFLGVDNRAKNMMLATWDGLVWYFLPYDMDTILGSRNDSVLKYDYTTTWDTMDESIGSYAFAGHDSVLWDLVRSCPDKLREVAEKLRSTMSLEYVLKVFNEEMMGNWCERIYNKDGEFKYVKPLTEGVTTSEGTSYYNYLYALQGSRYAHRTYTIKNRFALLDSQYVCGTYRKDSFAAYFGYKFGSDNRKVKIKASERYYFGYGYTSGTPHQSAVLADDTGSLVELTLDTDLIVNDPQYFYGASRIQELDLTDVSHAILQTLNLNNCTSLRNLDISCAGTQSTLNALLVSNCRHLRTLDMTGLKSGGFTGIDLSNNTKLEMFHAGNTALTGVTFAQGAPLMSAVLPSTLQTLDLRYLNKLSNENLALEGTDNIIRLVVDSCALIDWQTLLQNCPNVRYLRVTGIDMEGDGTFLRGFMEMGGVDEDGGNVTTCRLAGIYRLSSYMPDEEYNAMCAHFPEMTITQPEYTMIEFDDNISDEYNISNLDNRSGNKFGNAYVPSAHVFSIQKARHRVLSKRTGEGESTIFPLHDSDSNYYADADHTRNATPAKLDGTEGDVMMLEPHYWYKGINDVINGKKYACFSYNKNRPEIPECTILEYDDITEIRDGYKLSIAAPSIREGLKADVNYQVLKISVVGYKRVRYPSALGNGLIGAFFVDAEDTPVKEVVAEGSFGFVDGMYVICDVPSGACSLYFTIYKNVDFDIVVLSNSDHIEDMEPDWVEHEECLVGVHEASFIGSRITSIASNTYSAGNISQGEFTYSAGRRGMQVIDWDMHKDIANLFYVFYGRRDSQDQCGYGSNTYSRITGETAKLGMRDTINQNHAVTGAWYVESDEWGIETIKSIGCNNCMGYENLFGGKAEWLDKVTLPNDPVSEQYKLYIESSSGAIRKIKTSSIGGYMTKVYHQKYMDISGVSSSTGTSTTYYCDEFIPSATKSRVVFRSNSYAYAQGGVSYAYCGYDSAYVDVNYGSRLAFRGKIVVAGSVESFKSLVEIA